MVGDYFFLDFFTRAGNFLYWVDFAHFMQSTEPSKPLDAKQARDWALDLNGMLLGSCADTRKTGQRGRKGWIFSTVARSRHNPLIEWIHGDLAGDFR